MGKDRFTVNSNSAVCKVQPPMNVSGPYSQKRKREGNGEEDGYEGNDGFMDDEDEPHRFGTSVLPVANLPASFDGVPQDGLEYLFTVRREERRMPLVTRVLNPYPVNDTIAKGEASEKDSCQSDSLGALPSKEWRTCFQERFRNLRANIQQPTIHVSLPVHQSSEAPKLPDMRERDQWWAFFRGDSHWEDVPSSQYHTKKYGIGEKRKYEAVGYDEELPSQRGKMRGWVVYEEPLSWDKADDEGIAELSYGVGDGVGDMNGPGEAEEVEEQKGKEWHLRIGKGKEVTTEISLPTLPDSHSLSTASNLNAASPEAPSPREPTPKLLHALSQKTTFHLLKYFTQWIQGHFDRSFLPAPPLLSGPYLRNQEKQIYELKPAHARWIFALLSRLDAQLTSDEISVLRKLAREVMRVIKEEKSTTEQRSSMGETACWMVVAAVSGVWGQTDLWIDAEDILR